jgi:xanthine dehydrogenase YagS FAD-binding subunit
VRPLAYARAERVADALAAIGDGAGRPLAGGTDLLPLLKSDVVRLERLVDVKRAADLPRGIRVAGQRLEVGALTTLAQIEASDDVRRHAAALAEAAASAATPQLRNMATLGGNLLQRSRCWYFRHPLIPCWLKGADDCPAREGENQLHAIFATDRSPCLSVHPSDPVTALAALDADIRVRGADGDRTAPFADFFRLPTEEHRTETMLAQDEIVLGVSVPLGGDAGWRSGYAKAMDRKVWAFAQASVAIAVRLDGDRVAEARVALGGVAPIPMRAPEAERVLANGSLAEAPVRRAADAALRGARPLRNNGYKVALLRGLFEEAFGRLRQPTRLR